jgi:hypothetical protein
LPSLYADLLSDSFLNIPNFLASFIVLFYGGDPVEKAISPYSIFILVLRAATIDVEYLNILLNISIYSNIPGLPRLVAT